MFALSGGRYVNVRRLQEAQRNRELAEREARRARNQERIIRARLQRATRYDRKNARMYLAPGTLDTRVTNNNRF